MLKITQTLKTAGVFDSIVILATWKPGLEEREDLDETRSVWRIKTRKGKSGGGLLSKGLGMLEWIFRLLLQVRRLPVTCVNCHSLFVLPIGVILKRFKGCRLIYDTHELETETGSSHGIRKKLAKSMERTLIRHADAVIVVGDSIADWYRKEYPGIKVSVVKNAPYRYVGQNREENKGTPLRLALGVPQEEILFLYQGILGRGRGVEVLLNAFKQLPAGKHLAFLGFGPYEDEIRAAADTYPNIHFHPAVAPADIPFHTSSADVGLSVIENICLSYYLCMPNKIFEYLNCGVPIIVSDFPEMGKLVDTYNCGWKVEVDSAAIAKLVDGLTWDDVTARKAKALECRQELGWENEEPILLSVYRDIGLTQRAQA